MTRALAIGAVGGAVAGLVLTLCVLAYVEISWSDSR